MIERGLKRSTKGKRHATDERQKSRRGTKESKKPERRNEEALDCTGTQSVRFSR